MKRKDSPKARPRYREDDSLRAHLKKRANLTGKKVRANQPIPTVDPLMHFHSCLGDQEATIAKILEIIESAEKAKEEAAAKYKAKPKRSPDLAEIHDEMRLQTEAISNEEIQNIFSGTLFVMLNSLLMSLSSRVKKRGGGKRPDAAGRKIGKSSLFQLITAASNNFRHYEEWNKKQKSDKRMADNIAILKAAGLKRPWNRNLCGEVFDLIGWKDLDAMTLEIRKLASELFQDQTGIPL